MNRIPKDENPFRGPNRTMLRRTLFLAAVCVRYSYQRVSLICW